jgi:hypothetical protein
MPVSASDPNAESAFPWWIAADSNYLYVTEPYYLNCNPYCHGGSIGRINLDGSNPNFVFISTDGFPQGIAVNGSYLYWVDYSTGGSEYIERANLDGSSVDTSFQQDLSNKNGGGIALDGQYVYWAQSDPEPVGARGSIGRATLDGYNANGYWLSNQSVAYGQPWGVAVDGLTPPAGPSGGSQGGGPGGTHGGGSQGGPAGNGPNPTCTVPRLRGMTLAQARRALSRAHCGLGNVFRHKGRGVKHGRVLGSNPGAGRHLRPGAKVSLTVRK